jgi:hypothetical protein
MTNTKYISFAEAAEVLDVPVSSVVAGISAKEIAVDAHSGRIPRTYFEQRVRLEGVSAVRDSLYASLRKAETNVGIFFTIVIGVMLVAVGAGLGISA